MKKINKDEIEIDLLQSQENKVKDKIKKQTNLGNFFQKLENKDSLKIKESKSSFVGEKSLLGDGIWPKNNLLITSWNVNGLRAQLKRNDIKQFLEKYDPDIFCMNETKIDQEKFDSEVDQTYFPQHYYKFWSFCKPPLKGYSGVSIFSKTKPISVEKELGIYELDQEGRVICLEFEKFYIISTYIPNASIELKRLDYKLKEFMPSLYKFIDEKKKLKHVIWIGDLNVAHQEIDIANPKTNKNSPGFTIDERQDFGKFLDSGYIDLFRFKYPNLVKYSWWSMRTRGREKGIGWRLDYTIINKEFQQFCQDSIIYDSIQGSDHCPIGLLIDFELNNQNVDLDSKKLEEI